MCLLLPACRAGWRKDDFGGTPLNDAFGVTSLPPPVPATAAATAENGARGVRFADDADLQYPHTPYDQTPAGIEMLKGRGSSTAPPV